LQIRQRELSGRQKISPEKYDIIFISCSFVLFVVYSYLKIDSSKYGTGS